MIIVIVLLFKYLRSCLRADSRLQDDVRMRVCEGLKTSGVLRNMTIDSSENLCTRKELYKRVKVPTVTYGTGNGE